MAENPIEPRLTMMLMIVMMMKMAMRTRVWGRPPSGARRDPPRREGSKESSSRWGKKGVPMKKGPLDTPPNGTEGSGDGRSIALLKQNHGFGTPGLSWRGAEPLTGVDRLEEKEEEEAIFYQSGRSSVKTLRFIYIKYLNLRGS